ncbi:MAG: ABC transporter ATP-binding protein [Anaerolineae bacterium]
MALQPAVQTQGLTKSYHRGQRPALDHLTLTVNRGEIFGYLGPNGAGKTTTIRMLLDLIRPTSGSASLLGLDAQHDSVEIHKRIGFLPGELNLWQNLTAKQAITYLHQLRGHDDSAMRYAHELAERLQLDLGKPIRSYSTGNKRKIGLVIAMMHKPELLILDEPTSGLDPLMQQIFNQLVTEVRSEGRTVFLSSHILSEVQAICERVAIIRDGKLQAVERVSDLTRVKFHQLTLTFRSPVSPDRIANIPGVSEIKTEGNVLHLRLSGDFDPLLRALDGQYIVEVRSQEPSLEETFLSYYGAANGSSAKKEVTQ